MCTNQSLRYTQIVLQRAQPYRTPAVIFLLRRPHHFPTTNLAEILFAEIVVMIIIIKLCFYFYWIEGMIRIVRG